MFVTSIILVIKQINKRNATRIPNDSKVVLPQGQDVYFLSKYFISPYTSSYTH